MDDGSIPLECLRGNDLLAEIRATEAKLAYLKKRRKDLFDTRESAAGHGMIEFVPREREEAIVRYLIAGDKGKIDRRVRKSKL